MKNNNKILMSLVLASISAMAAAPFLMEDKEEGKDLANNNANTGDTKVVEGKKILNIGTDSVALSSEAKDDFTKQLDAMLMKKTSVEHLSESISILTDSYGKDNQSMKS